MRADRDPTPCSICRFQGWLCVCALAPRIVTRTSILLLVHVREWGRLSNTARLLSLAVHNATRVCHGRLLAPIDPASYLPAETTPVVLFPGQGAQPLMPELIAALPSPPALIVPDGNWRQANNMVKRLPLLAGAIKVSLPTRAFTGRTPRRNGQGCRMSTFEAVTQALGLLEGEEAVGPLLDFYRRAVDRILLARGKLRISDVYGGIDGPPRSPSQ